MKEMRYVWVLAVVCVLCLVLAQGARGEELCPPTETPFPPTELVEPTPSSPPPATNTPENTRTVEPTPEFTATPEDTRPPVETTTPDPGPSETPGITETPGSGQPSAPTKTVTPTVIETLPVTGGGMPPHVQIGLTLICGIVLFFVAGMARRGRGA